MEKDLVVKVTKLGRRWHARLYVDGKLQPESEWACQLKQDVGYICLQLLRWYDKLGGNSSYASAARARQKNPVPVGKIWGPGQLPVVSR